MAGVAEAMAASSILLENGSVASGGGHTVDSRTQQPQVARSCICFHGSACHRMSAAFALLKDPRGDFVKLPSSEFDLCETYYRYLRPGVNGRDIKDGSVGGSNGSGYDNSDNDAESYNSEVGHGDDDSCGERSSRGSYSSGSYSSRSSERSYDSRSSERSYSSRSCDGSYSSERSYSSRSSDGTDYTRGSSRSGRSNYSHDGNGNDENMQKQLPSRVKHDHYADDFNDDCEDVPGDLHGNKRAFRLDLSELSENEDLPEEFVAAHHFHPDVLVCFFNLQGQDRPASDLLPVPLQPMSADDRRACGVPIEDDDFDRVMNPCTGEEADEQFWIVPSYPLSMAHEDWKQLMRNRLRNMDVSTSVAGHKKDDQREGLSEAPHTHATSQNGAFGSMMGKWEMAYALANQMMDQTSGTASKGFPRQGSEQSLISLKEESTIATQETAALSQMLSSSLESKSLVPPAREFQVWEADIDAGKTGDDYFLDPHAGDDSSESEPSRTSSEASDTTGTLPGHATAPLLSYHQTNPDFPLKSDTKMAPDIKLDPNPGPFVYCATESKRRRPILHCLSTFIFRVSLVTAVIGALHIAWDSKTREQAMACSRPSCVIACAKSSFVRNAQPRISRHVQLSKDVAKASLNFVVAAAMELPPLKALGSRTCSARDYILATPPEIQILILNSYICSARDYACEVAVELVRFIRDRSGDLSAWLLRSARNHANDLSVLVQALYGSILALDDFAYAPRETTSA